MFLKLIRITETIALALPLLLALASLFVRLAFYPIVCFSSVKLYYGVAHYIKCK